jgi:AcrR family transcriptional regulator
MSDPVWAREKPRRRPVLSRDVIVDAAVRIADAEGLDAVSIRRIAADLGVRPMSLYTHIDRKEDLLALMRDQVNAEVLIGDQMPGDWRAALTAIAERTRDVVLAHRWLVSLMGFEAHAGTLGPYALRHLEESLTAIRSLNLDPVTAAEVLSAVDRFVMGHVSFEMTAHDAAEASVLISAYLEGLLASGDFPELAKAAAGGALEAGRSAQSFARGLTWLLDGIEADIATGE